MGPAKTPSTKRHGWLRFFLIAGIVVSIALSPLVIVASASGRNAFKFLGGRSPFLTGVFPIIQDGYVSKGYTDEYRVYSWKKEYDFVARAATAELTPRGFVLEKTRWPMSATFTRADGCQVSIDAKRSESRKDAFHGSMGSDPRWVTVVSSDPIPDTWITHLRYALEPN